MQADDNAMKLTSSRQCGGVMMDGWGEGVCFKALVTLELESFSVTRDGE